MNHYITLKILSQKCSVFVYFITLFWSFQVTAQTTYSLTEDSKVQQGVPVGNIMGPYPLKSKVFPDTVREYWIYVPQQYEKKHPACLMVSFDGLGRATNWKLPIVMDNLIHKKEIPITIGVFVGTGVQGTHLKGTYDRPVRSLEYDSRGTALAAMIVDELLPKVKAEYNISKDPNDHLIAGNSSGGNAAFNVAWERPDVFRRVYTGIGSYTALRGGHDFMPLIRKTEHKPLRIFLQDGSNDLDNFSGSWFIANQYMLSSLKWAGYEVHHVWGEDTHSARHGTAIMPDILRWLWKDYPKPVGKITGKPKEKEPQPFIDREAWKNVTKEYKGITALSANAEGEVFFLDMKSGTALYTIRDGGTITKLQQSKDTWKGLALSEKKELCTCIPDKKQIVKVYPGKPQIIAKNIQCDDLLMTKTGIYFINKDPGQYGYFKYSDMSVAVFDDIKHPGGLSLSAEHSFLNISDTVSAMGYSIPLKEDGTPLNPLAFFHYHTPYVASESNAGSMVVDRENQTYTATAMGIQMADQLGRTRIIIPIPDGSIPIQLCFGGSALQRLYVTTKTGIFSRKLNYKGAPSWHDPVTPPQPPHVAPIKK